MNIQIGNEVIEEKNVAKFLGMYIDSKLDWHEHLKYTKSKLNSSIYAMNKVRHLLTRNHLLTLYNSLVYPYLDYGITLWGSTHKSYLNKIIIMQKNAIRIVAKAKYNAHTDPLFIELKLLKLEDLQKLKLSKYMFALNKGLLPSPLTNMIAMNRDVHTHNTRNYLHVEQRRTRLASNSLRHMGPLVWYKTPLIVRESHTANSFTRKYKRHVLQCYTSCQ
jgi:hypothetical protein